MFDFRLQDQKFFDLMHTCFHYHASMLTVVTLAVLSSRACIHGSVLEEEGEALACGSALVLRKVMRHHACPSVRAVKYVCKHKCLHKSMDLPVFHTIHEECDPLLFNRRGRNV